MSYTVQEGDTLTGIGSHFGIDWHAIAQANGITNPNLIQPGQVLKIPRPADQAALWLWALLASGLIAWVIWRGP